MKAFILSLLVLTISSGCQNAPSNLSIIKDNEILHEGSFEIQYPANWKITNERDNPNTKERRETYYFHHPKKKDLYIKVQILNFSNRPANENTKVRSILSKIAHAQKKAFDKEGYTVFNFKIKDVRLARYKATRLTIRGSFEDMSRETIAIVIPQAKTYYVISYQWFSDWGTKIKRRLEEITKSFQFIG